MVTPLASAGTSRLGASNRVPTLVAGERLVPLVTTALFLDYEDVFSRAERRSVTRMTKHDAEGSVNSIERGGTTPGHCTDHRCARPSLERAASGTGRLKIVTTSAAGGSPVAVVGPRDACRACVGAVLSVRELPFFRSSRASSAADVILYWQAYPPSALTSAPVMNGQASDKRNSTALPISLGVPSLWIGWAVRNIS